MIDDKYIVIQGWMVTELKLSGNELLLYSLINGFCQDGESRFTGSLKYIEHWLNVSKNTALNTLKSLCEKGYIVKYETVRNSIKFCEYISIRPSRSNSTGGAKIELPSQILDEKEQIGGAKIAPNIYIDNIKDSNMSENKISDETVLSEELSLNTKEEKKEEESCAKEEEKKFMREIDIKNIKDENLKIAFSFWLLFKEKKDKLNIKPTTLMKAKTEKWMDEMREIIEKDGRDIKSVRNVYLFLSKSTSKKSIFWSGIIQSISNLREHFERIEMDLLTEIPVQTKTEQTQVSSAYKTLD